MEVKGHFQGHYLKTVCMTSLHGSDFVIGHSDAMSYSIQRDTSANIGTPFSCLETEVTNEFEKGIYPVTYIAPHCSNQFGRLKIYKTNTGTLIWFTLLQSSENKES